MIFNHFLPEWFLVTSEQSGTGKSSSFINKYFKISYCFQASQAVLQACY